MERGFIIHSRCKSLYDGSQLYVIKQYDAPACHGNDGGNACDNSYDDTPDGNSCNVHARDDSDRGDA